jgi:peptidoglycan/xylan/chitin deacetylase (PgdA/CDA1 family)
LKLKRVGLITTGLVILAGLIVVMPLFFGRSRSKAQPVVMLSFSITDPVDAIPWSQALSQVLRQRKIGASVFIVGQIAEQYPAIFSDFATNVDIGSQTYGNIRLAAIADYAAELAEVRDGKQAVDEAGRLTTSIFRAPFGATDQDIYSILSRSGILADFSYAGQFNVFRDNQFIKYEAMTFVGHELTENQISDLVKSSSKPIIVYFDNHDSISLIDHVISLLSQGNVHFVNASELAGIPLTNWEPD